MTYVLGREDLATRPLPPYAPLACELLAKLSEELRAAPGAASHPDVAAFAFWCRRGNVEAMRKRFEDGRKRLGLGLAFHIAPANVPLNFAYSFALGLLAGNANLVRLPSAPFPQAELLCGVLRRLLELPEFAALRAMTAFVRYEADDRVSGDFSARSDARVLWGGDATIRALRRLPTPERCVDVAFADRYSLCLLDAPAVAALDDAGLSRLAESFYNDAYFMDQNACSSPHLVVWQGKGAKAAKPRFWEAVDAVVGRRYALAEQTAVEKYLLLCRDAVRQPSAARFRRHGNRVYRVELDRLPPDLDALRGKAGYFYEHDLREPGDLWAAVNGKYQTLTYFGVDKDRLGEQVLEQRLAGIDRIVPVGQALDMAPVWDGYDIVRTLSRIIDIK